MRGTEYSENVDAFPEIKVFIESITGSADEGGKKLDLIYIRKLLKTNIKHAVKPFNELRVFGHKSNDSFG